MKIINIKNSELSFFFKKGFTLAEVILVIVIMMSVLLGSVALVGPKKLKRPVKPFKPHGTFECYWDGNNLMSYYTDNSGVTLGPEIVNSEYCEFNPPEADYFNLQVIGAGQESVLPTNYQDNVFNINVANTATELGLFSLNSWKGTIRENLAKEPTWVAEYWDKQWENGSEPYKITIYPYLAEPGRTRCRFSFRGDDSCVWCSRDISSMSCNFSYCVTSYCGVGGRSSIGKYYEFDYAPLVDETITFSKDASSTIFKGSDGENTNILQITTFPGTDGNVITDANGAIGTVNGINGADIIIESSGISDITSNDTNFYFPSRRTPIKSREVVWNDNDTENTDFLAEMLLRKIPHNRNLLSKLGMNILPLCDVAYFKNDPGSAFTPNEWNTDVSGLASKFAQGSINIYSPAWKSNDSSYFWYTYSQQSFSIDTSYSSSGRAGDYVTTILPELNVDNTLRLYPQKRVIDENNNPTRCSRITEIVDNNEIVRLECQTLANTSQTVSVNDINPIKKNISKNDLFTYVEREYNSELLASDISSSIDFYINSMAVNFTPGKSGSGKYPLLFPIPEDYKTIKQFINNTVVNQENFEPDINIEEYLCINNDSPIQISNGQYYCNGTSANPGAVVIVW